MSIISKGAFLAAACLLGAAGFAGPSQAGGENWQNALSPNALSPNALGGNALGGNALSDNALSDNALLAPSGEADMAGMALNGMRLDSTTVTTIPDPVWAKDTEPPDPD